MDELPTVSHLPACLRVCGCGRLMNRQGTCTLWLLRCHLLPFRRRGGLVCVDCRIRGNFNRKPMGHWQRRRVLGGIVHRWSWRRERRGRRGCLASSWEDSFWPTRKSLIVRREVGGEWHRGAVPAEQGHRRGERWQGRRCHRARSTIVLRREEGQGGCWGRGQRWWWWRLQR